MGNPGKRSMQATMPATEQKLTPGQWVWQRLGEVKTFVVFQYNLLRDPRLPFSLKVYPFTALRYLFSERSVIPNTAPIFGFLDDLTVLMVCNREMIERLPIGTLCLYQQILYAEGVRLRRITGEAPEKLGLFFFHIAALFPRLVEEERPNLGNALITGKLVRSLNHFLQTYQQPEWNPLVAEKVDRFLSVYQ